MEPHYYGHQATGWTATNFLLFLPGKLNVIIRPRKGDRNAEGY